MGGGEGQERENTREEYRKRRQHEERESCAKTKTEMGLVTAMVGAPGLALTPGPLHSHPQEAEPLSGEGVAVEPGLGEVGPASQMTVGLVTVGQQRSHLAHPRPNQTTLQAWGWGVGAASCHMTQTHSTEHKVWHAVYSQ
jgi:hypothetical protein